VSTHQVFSFGNAHCQQCCYTRSVVYQQQPIESSTHMRAHALHGRLHSCYCVASLDANDERQMANACTQSQLLINDNTDQRCLHPSISCHPHTISRS
jgi:hypothetical protein